MVIHEGTVTMTIQATCKKDSFNYFLTKTKSKISVLNPRNY